MDKKTIDWEQRMYETAKGLMTAYVYKRDGSNIILIARKSIKGASTLMNMLKRKAEEEGIRKELEEKRKEWKEKRKEWEEIPVNNFDLSVRALNCLHSCGVKTLGDLVTLGREGFSNVRNAGKKSLMEIDDLLQTLGLQW